MSDIYINIRVGMTHFQLTRDWRIRISRNPYHRQKPWYEFEIYEFKPFK